MQDLISRLSKGEIERADKWDLADLAQQLGLTGDVESIREQIITLIKSR